MLQVKILENVVLSNYELKTTGAVVDDAEIYWTRDGRSTNPDRTSIKTVGYGSRMLFFLIKDMN